ncbi:MAG: hypothetical protein E7178_04890 [Erysipelotrichaceae bacterium]|nr:hypothetical protein [Erysipelotrichaceae bacterium]
MKKYLVFDLEKASCFNNQYKVCEFGYVICDESFTAIKSGNFYINPNILSDQWDYYALKKLLYRKKSFYEEQPTFDAFYDEIKALFNQADYVFGHTVAGDIQGINDECQRYHLKPINCVFYDIKEFYKVLVGTKEDVGVTRLRDLLEITDEYKEHDAKSDAYTTMLELKAMLNKYEISLEDLIAKSPKAKDETVDFVIASYKKRKEAKAEREKRMVKAIADGKYTGDGTNLTNHHENKKLLLQFLDNATITEEVEKIFDGKKISIGINYEFEHFVQIMNIVQMIVNRGGTYVLKGSESDIFVRYDRYKEDGSLDICNRLKYVQEAIDNGKNIEIITFKEFLSKLGISEEELDNMPFPSLSCLLKEDAIIKNGKFKTKKNKQKEPVKQEVEQPKENKLGSRFNDVFDQLEKDLDK